MTQFRLFNFHEVGFFYNRDFDYSGDDKKKLNLNVHCALVCKADSDAAILRVGTDIDITDTRVMSYTIDLGFVVKDWAKAFFRLSDNELKQTDLVRDMLAHAIEFYRGALAVRAIDTDLRNAFIPQLDIESLAQEIDVIKRD